MSFVTKEFWLAMLDYGQERVDRVSEDYCPNCDRIALCLKPRWLRAVAQQGGWHFSFSWNRACLECGWTSTHTPIKNKKLRAAVYEADNHECVYCGKQERIGLDHVVPQTRGGAHTFENLLTCCHWCNVAKKDRHELTPQYGRYRKTEQ